MSTITQIGPVSRVMIFVGDVEVCGAFYRDVLGLMPVKDTHEPGEWLELDAGNCRIALHKAYKKDGPLDGPTGGADVPYKITFTVPDVAAAREELIARGAEMLEIRQFDGLDLCDGIGPEGHRFQLCNR